MLALYNITSGISNIHDPISIQPKILKQCSYVQFPTVIIHHLLSHINLAIQFYSTNYFHIAYVKYNIILKVNKEQNAVGYRYSNGFEFMEINF